jgi:hypothetical protein
MGKGKWLRDCILNSFHISTHFSRILIYCSNESQPENYISRLPANVFIINPALPKETKISRH